MPEAQAAPAPAAASSPATTPEPISAPGAETPPAANEPKKRGKARHAEIRAQLAKAAGKPAPAPEAKPADAAPAADKPAEEPKKPAVGAVMRLTAENTKLKARLDELETASKKSASGETIESLRERVKKDPAVLFDVFGADLDVDENNRLVKLNDAVLGRADPEHAKQREVLSEVEKLKKQLADKDAEVASAAERDRDHRARAHTSQVLTDGFKSEDGKVVIDPAKYPFVNHLTKSGEVDAHLGVMHATRELAADFRKTKGREPTETEIIGFISIAAGQAEEYFSKRAKNWQLPQAPATTPAPEPDQRRTPTTIGSGLGGRAALGADTRQLSKREKHELIRQRLRQANRQAAAN